MKPDFFCIGTQKAGTTTLHDILKQHPEIYLPKDKEAHFFDHDKRYKKGIEWYYKKFYSTYNKEPVVGSFTPEYCFYPKVPERIFNSFGTDLKFIFILRNPIDRAVSHYNMSKARLYENLTFEEAVVKEKDRIKKGEFEFNHFSYFSRGDYLEQINRYLKFFPIEQFLFLDFDLHIKNNLPNTLLHIQNFLGIKTLDLNASIHSNKAFIYKNNTIPQMILNQSGNGAFIKKIIPSVIKSKLRHYIMNFFKTENTMKFKLSKQEAKNYFSLYFESNVNQLEKITKLNLTHWKKYE